MADERFAFPDRPAHSARAHAGTSLLRIALAVALLPLMPARVTTQAPAFTVDAASATVHRAPSTGSVVIGQVQRGTVLEVTHDLGSWVKVVWPESEDGVGYVHVSRGTRRGTAPAPTGTVAPTRAEGAALSSAAMSNGHVAGTGAATSIQPAYVSLPAHTLGLGARTGSAMLGSGASARAWFGDRIGVQFEVSRSALTSPALDARMTSTQLAPSVLYALPDHISDYMWIRPYVGAGVRMLRHSMALVPQPGAAVSSNDMGFLAFGGGELTFSSLPRFAVSVDLRRGWAGEWPDGYNGEGIGFSIGAHWYVR